MLEITSLHRRYGRQTVLDAVDLSLPPGSLNILSGVNGAGKSTLLRLLAQVERPTSGKFTLGGKPPRIESTGYLPQHLGFHPLLTVSHVIEFYAEVWNLPLSAARAALIRWGLESHARKRTGELSGGLRQRLGLAILGLRSFELLLLDEPGLSLDTEWRRVLRAWLATLAGEGALILVTTHLQVEWESVADRLLCCRDGKVHVGASLIAHSWSETRQVVGGEG